MLPFFRRTLSQRFREKKTFRDQYVKLKDRLSCHGAHGMEEKKGLESDNAKQVAISHQSFIVHGKDLMECQQGSCPNKLQLKQPWSRMHILP